ncbi:MAG: SMC-Scp complex subunit ScpB [Gammaproteobacteria bacterium]
MEAQSLKGIVEAVVLAAEEPVSVDRLLKLFAEHERPGRDEVCAALEALGAECAGRGVELVEVASGFRYQVRRELAEWASRLREERPPRYSRAFLETLALIAYRQPVTRGEIEDIRGVSVSSSIIKTFEEREWVRIVGHREVPGRPAMYGTTRRFLDDFNLKSLDELPTLAELRDLSQLNVAFPLDEGEDTAAQAGEGGDAADAEAGDGEASGDAAAEGLSSDVTEDSVAASDPAFADERD